MMARVLMQPRPAVVEGWAGAEQARPRGRSLPSFAWHPALFVIKPNVVLKM